MKVTKEQSSKNRDAIIAAASKLYRQRGIDRVGIAEIMAEAGLTHGGFYRHFESKEALFGEATFSAFLETANIFAKLAGTEEGKRRFAKGYLSEARIQRDLVCPIAALASDTSRQDESVQAQFAEGLRHYFGREGHEVGSPEWTKDVHLIAKLVGIVLMARAVHKADPALSRELTKSILSELEAPK